MFIPCFFIGKLFITFQECKGKFGKRVDKKVRDLEKDLGNIRVFCSSSGLMDKLICQQWASELIDPDYINQFIVSSEKPKILVCLDGYPAHWNGNIDNSFGEWDVELLKIPERTTSVLQPLDCLFNHQLKYFVRKIENRVQIDDLDIKVYDRFNLMKMWSLIWEQFSSDKFVDLISYCFNKTFLQTKNQFQTVRDICFTSKAIFCDLDDCSDNFFMKCSICEKNICFNHFFINFHSHKIL